MTPANLDLTLLNIVPTKTVLRKKHRPDDETLNSQPGDEAEPQWAASDTQSEANAIAIGGESYQLAQATVPASVVSGAATATPVIESALLTNLLLAGAVAGGAAAFAGGKTGAGSTATPTADTTAPTFTSAATATIAENTLTSSTVYDATADSDVGVNYTLTGADAALFNIAATTGLVTFKVSPNFEIPTDAGANNVYDFTVTATDASNNATSQAVQLTVTDVVDAGQAVIDLGSYGKLIAPVQVEGKWYYFWDRSGDGTSTDTGILNGGVDYTTHNVLDSLFNHDISGVTNSTVLNADGAYGSTDSYRYGTINGVNLALPTANGGVAYPQGINAYQNGTSYTDAGASTNGTSSSFNDLLAVWDAYNGSGTGAGINGTPAGWQALNYWSATPSASGHALVYLYGGDVSSNFDYGLNYVALQVLALDTTAPTFTSAATATLAENTPTSTTVYDATADGDVGVTYTLTGADAALFNIAAVRRSG